MSKYVTMDSGRREHFRSGMVRDVREGKGRFDLISPFAIKRLAQVYERGAAKYDDRNWEKGAPYCRFLDSALRHINQYLSRETDEDHLAQAAWNLLAIMHFEEVGRTELDDRPKYEPLPPKKVYVIDTLPSDSELPGANTFESLLERLGVGEMEG